MYLSLTIKRPPNITSTVLLKTANTSNLSYLQQRKKQFVCKTILLHYRYILIYLHSLGIWLHLIIPTNRYMITIISITTTTTLIITTAITWYYLNSRRNIDLGFEPPTLHDPLSYWRLCGEQGSDCGYWLEPHRAATEPCTWLILTH